MTVSHSSLIRLLDLTGKGFDVEVKQWRDSIVPLLNSSHVCVSINNSSFAETIPYNAANPKSTMG